MKTYFRLFSLLIVLILCSPTFSQQKYSNSNVEVSPTLKQRNVLVTESIWDVLMHFDVSNLTGAAGNSGAGYNGTYFYSTRWASNLIHEYSSNGSTLIREFSIPGLSDLRDLAWDGNYIYGGTASNTIYQMDFETNSIVGTISSPVAVRFIAYDEVNDAFWVGNWSDPATLVSRTGATLATITTGLTAQYGAAYDNVSTGGPYLWIFDQGLGVGTPQLIHQFDITTGTATGVTHDVAADFPGNLGIAGGLFSGVYSTGTNDNYFVIGGLLQGTPDEMFVYGIAPAGPPCPIEEPTNPTPSDNTSDALIEGISLVWSNGTGTEMTEVWFGEVGDPQLVYDGTPIESFSLPVLNYSTSYSWYIVGKNSTCGVSGPTWSFTTMLNPNIVCPFIDDFESGTGNWNISNDGGTCEWDVSYSPYPNSYTLPPTSNGGILSADSDVCGSGTTLLSTATMNVSVDATNLETVWIEWDNDWKSIDTDDEAFVEVSTDGGASWMEIVHWLGVDMRNTHEVWDITSIAAGYQFKIRFRTIQPGWDWWWVIDNVNICGVESELQFGNITGTVFVNGIGLEKVIVTLLDDAGIPVEGFNDINTDADGHYSFNEVPAGDYQVMIVEPLGFISDENPKSTTVAADETNVVDFNLTEVVVMNNARSKGYWKHQFNVYLTGNGNAHESEEDLYNYIDLIHDHYTSLYPIFENVNTFEEWSDVLSVDVNSLMIEKAKEHLAALLFNLVSLKIGQYTIVTEDDKTAGDVLDYVSVLITDSDDTNDELAKVLAENVNNQQMISSGIVPDGSNLFKEGLLENQSFRYSLFDNYPNPFNPYTTIEFELAKDEFVELKVYDILGSEVESLVKEMKETGHYKYRFDASNLPSGIYFYRLTAGDFVQVKKMVLMK